MALLRNPDTSKKTIYVPVNEGQYEDWHKQHKWMWTSKIRDGAFVVIIVSYRGCYIRHDGKFVELTAEQQRDYKETLEKDLGEVCIFKREEFAHDGRLFIVAPVTKSNDDPESERAANAFAQQIGRSLEYKTELKAQLVFYDSATVKEAIVYDPEYGSVEINFDPEEHKQPQVYINGEAC
jgi:mRNA degradation ribonuclease J1/J2